jgi:hypothetical protein
MVKMIFMGKDKSEKTTMGKDREGTFHPGKGKPSGINKEEGLGIQATPPEKMDEYLEISDKYTAGEDQLAEHVPLRHPNRNTSKGEDTYKGKENKEESNKSNNQTFTEERSRTEPEELPGVLSKEIFAELANYKADLTVSLFIPTHSAGVEINEHYDPIAFKKALQQVAAKLKERGYDQTFIEPLLKPGFDLIRDDAFWLRLSQGLAVFIAEGYFKYIKMPAAPTEELVIEPTFYVTPLIPLMTSKEYFYLLAISKQSAKLFKADAYGMEFVPVELPQSIEEVKRISGLDATTFRSGSSGKRAPTASQEGAYHGIGGGNPEDKDNIATYFEAVDDILFKEIFNKENAPLVLAGVEYLIPIYKQCCDYHNVWPEPLTGNRDRQETGALYQEAKELMQPYFQQGLTKALQNFGNKSATELTSSIAADIIPAAYYGRVSQLFVCKGEHIWGTFDEMTSELQYNDAPNEDGEDLIDNTVVKTLATGGEVFLLDREQMPAEGSMAALLRY